MGGGASSWRYAAAPHGAHPISRRYAHAPRANAYPFSSPRVRIVHADAHSISSPSPQDVRVHATAYSLARLRGPAARAYPHSPHLAVAAFAQHHVVPVIGALAARVDQRIEVRGAVIELHALAQALEYRVLDLTQYTHRVFAFDLAGGMHQTIGELAVVGEQQQAQRVEVEATHGDPASADAWQAIEYGRPSFRIGLTAYLAGGFVIHEHARPRLFHRRRRSDDAAIDAHDVAVRDTGAELRGRVVDGDASGAYPFFDAATRTHTGTRQPFLSTSSHDVLSVRCGRRRARRRRCDRAARAAV